MTLYFNEHSTPLVFGFLQGWIYAILLWIRGWRSERLSDYVLALLIVACCLEVMDYMLGFLGVEILWQELEFFPRDIGLLLGPLSFFYLKSQINVGFRFTRRDLWHALPFVIETAYHLVIFSLGHDAVQLWEEKIHRPWHIDQVESMLYLASNYFYLYLSLRLYQEYGQWVPTQFSDTETISFRWFRNFLIAFTVTISFNWFMYFLDIWLDLSFSQDWWNELVIAGLIYYLSIAGYAQLQPVRRVAFQPETAIDSVATVPSTLRAEALSEERLLPPDMAEWLEKLLFLMEDQKPYLNPELSLPDLSRLMHTNSSLLSQVINLGVRKNFNDFVNEYRITEFKRLVHSPLHQHMSLLGKALDAGFNSKSTFNRVFKKNTGLSPKEFVDQLSPNPAPGNFSR